MRFDFQQLDFVDNDVTPSKLAVAGSDGDITWSELAKTVKQFADLFRGLNIPSGHPVILRGHKEANFPAAMLAAAQCGLPYVPVDTVNPTERLRKIMDLTGSQVVVHFSGNEEGINPAVHIFGDEFRVEENGKPEFHSENVFWRPEDPLQYIIFTSGSTGEPKGVQITREAILSYIDWLERDFGFSSDDCFINQATFSFDLSTYELMLGFQLGGSLILNTNEVSRNPAAFVERIAKYRGSVWVSTPSFVYLFLREPTFTKSNLPNLRTFLFGGEDLPNRTVRRLLEGFPETRVLNTYGPTEATNTVSLVNIDKAVVDRFSVLPVGYPKYTTEILIENDLNDPSNPGEIIIVGKNVSIGYLRNLELTKERFFLHNGQRAYRTGDFGYLHDGLLFFSGRKDDQVKLHGFRIELNEINSYVANLDFVEAVVTVPLRTEKVVKRIVTFVKLKSGSAIEAPANILSYLKDRLPGYMVPSEVKVIAEFPYNDNHKVDKTKLLNWYSSGITAATET